MNRIEHYHALGFNRSTHTFGRPNLISIACDSCASVVINNIPCHERGCPNATHECNGCNERIPVSRKYCNDCL